MYIIMYGAKLQPKLLPKLFPHSIIYEEEIRQVCDNLKSLVKLKEGKLGFMQYPCDIGYCTYWSVESFLYTIYIVDPYYFQEVEWMDYNPHGNIASLCKKLNLYMVPHEVDPFKDAIIEALNNNQDLVPIWEQYPPKARPNS